MEIVNEGSLESISRPATSDSTRLRESAQLHKHGSFGFLEELPPEDTVVSVSLNEEVSSGDDDDDVDYDIISAVESDVVIEDIAERSATDCSSITEEDTCIAEEVYDNSGTSEPVHHAGQHGSSQTESKAEDQAAEMQLDPKIRKGLEKIKKLDAILANKIKWEKEVKVQRRQMERRWREEINQLDLVREQEGHGKIELGVGHALALGPPNDNDDEPTGNLESVPITPVFPTQHIPDDFDNSSVSPSEQGIHSRLQMESQSESVNIGDKSTKKTRKKKRSRKSGPKEKAQNFVKRNIELAADAGNVIPMTEAEKKRLEELLSDDNDLLMVENAYSEGLAIPAGEGFTLDTDSMSTLHEIDSKLQDLVPKEEMDLLTSKNKWQPLETSEKLSIKDGTGVKDFDSIGLGERILREEKEMREMKMRLQAIEDQLQSLYNETGDDCESVVSETILAKLIGGSSRTTSRSTTISESVMSALSSARTFDEHHDDKNQLALEASQDCCTSRAESDLGLP